MTRWKHVTKETRELTALSHLHACEPTCGGPVAPVTGHGRTPVRCTKPLKYLGKSRKKANNGTLCNFRVHEEKGQNRGRDPEQGCLSGNQKRPKQASAWNFSATFQWKSGNINASNLEVLTCQVRTKTRETQNSRTGPSGHQIGNNANRRNNKEKQSEAEVKRRLLTHTGLLILARADTMQGYQYH